MMIYMINFGPKKITLLHSTADYQLAFFTPGILPSKAAILNGYWRTLSALYPLTGLDGSF